MPLCARIGRLFKSSICQRAGVELDEVFERADFLRAGRQDQILRADGRDHIVARQAVRAQGLRVKIHLHLALLAAVGKGHRGALHRRQLGAQDGIAQVEQMRFGQRRTARQRQLQDRHAGGVVGQDERRGRAGRREGELGLRDRRDLRDGEILIDVRLKEVFHDRGAVDRLRLGVFDVVHRRLRGALGEQHDAVRDFLRQDAVVAPDHRGDRDLDVGEDVRRGVQDRVAAEQHDQHRQHDEGVGPL